MILQLVVAAAGLALGVAALMYRYGVVNGLEHGAFYAKGAPERPFARLRRAVANIHSLGPEDGRALALAFAAPSAALLVVLGLWWSALSAVALVTFGAFVWADNWRQVWINRGSGLPDVDPRENPKQEHDVGRWRAKLLYGRGRRWRPVVILAPNL